MNALKLTVLGYVKRAVNVRDDEVRVLLWAFAYFFCLLCAYYVLRPVRDAMGLAGGVRNLQWLFTATFLKMLIAVPIFGVVVAKFPRRKFLTWVYLFFIANILIFYFVFSNNFGKLLLRESFSFGSVYLTYLSYRCSGASRPIYSPTNKATVCLDLLPPAAPLAL
jgi:ATP/ADP translocase